MNQYYNSVPYNKLKLKVQMIVWDGQKLKETREKLGLRQKDVAEFMGLTAPSISAIETGKASNPWAIQLYGVLLERYYAATQGYVPVYAKYGTSEIMNEESIHYNAINGVTIKDKKATKP